MERISPIATAENESIWGATIELPKSRRLTADVECDICVVGGGISGLTTAFLLAKTGKRVIVLDDGPLASGMTSAEIVERLIAQIVRRRASYLALVYGQAGPLHDQDDPGATATSLRAGIAELVCRALPGLDPGVTHAWVAYVEDRALHAGADTAREAAHCVAALQALRALEPAG